MVDVPDRAAMVELSGSRATLPTPALSARLVLQFAKDEEIKLDGSHLAQVFAGTGHEPDWRVSTQVLELDVGRMVIWLGSTGLLRCAYMMQEPALTVSRPPVAQCSPRSPAGCRATAAPIPKLSDY